MGIVYNPFTGNFDITGAGGGGGGAVDSVNGQTGVVVLDTDDVNEGATNLYFTDTRAQDAVVEDAINDGVIDKSPSENAVFDALALKANLSSFGLLNDQEIYADIIGGSNVTGVGSVVFPVQTLEYAISLCSDTAKKYVIFLSPGTYSSGPITIPSNISLYGKNANISNPVTIDFLVGIESTPVYDGISAEFIMDMSTSNISIATFRDGAYSITRTDNTTGPYFFSVNNSNVSDVDLTGAGVFNNCLFISTASVQNDGRLLLNGCVIGINIDVLGTGSISMTGSTFSGSITGTDDGGNTPEVFADSSTLGYGGVITGADVNDLDSASFISYNPATPANWTVPPAQVKPALDELASRISAPSRFTSIFDATTSWGSPSGGVYTITVTQAAHGRGNNPNVQLYELVSGNNELVNVQSLIVNPSGDVSIQVPDTPDLRFAGTLLII